jgi:signal transduction histidine kinase
MGANPGLVAKLDWQRIVVAASGLCCALLGAVILQGWFSPLDYPLISWSRAMPNAGLALLLDGLGLAAIASGRSRLALTGAAWSLLLGAVTLGEYLFSIDLRLDRLLIRHNWAGNPFPGRIGPNVALGFVLAGLVLWWASAPRKEWRWIGAMALLSGVVFATGAVSAFAHLPCLSPYAAWSQVIPRVGALDAAIGFTLLGSGLLFVVWRRAREQEGGFSPWLMFAVAAGGLTVALCFGHALSTLNLDRTADIAREVGWDSEKVARVAQLADGNLPFLLAGIGCLVTLLLVLMANQTLASRRQAHAVQRAQEDLLALHEQLEQRVRERTAELSAVNQELEAFTYSVSHDLRAPLRWIDGYTQILAEGLGGQTSEDVTSAMRSIRRGVRQMAQLIDALLTLSRIGKQELRVRITDARSIVDEVMAELAPETGARNVEWRIGPLPCVLCDPALLKLVFRNLLSNAAKFTQPRPVAVIEMGSLERNGEMVIFVRDNGVGFDMRYADKLFGVFQRLHRQEEFPGTGVGLATVQRILHKHNGRIWAESEVDHGATFYFTLGEQRPAQVQVVAEAPDAQCPKDILSS